MHLLVYTQVRACMHAKLLQLCLILCNPMDCSPPGSSVHGILQARILEWVARPSSRGPSPPRDQTWTPCTAGIFFLPLNHQESPHKYMRAFKHKRSRCTRVHTHAWVCTHIHARMQAHTHIRACVQRLKSTGSCALCACTCAAHVCSPWAHMYTYMLTHKLPAPRPLSAKGLQVQASSPGPALLSPLATSSPSKKQTSPASGVWYAPALLEEGRQGSKNPRGNHCVYEMGH